MKLICSVLFLLLICPKAYATDALVKSVWKNKVFQHGDLKSDMKLQKMLIDHQGGTLLAIKVKGPSPKVNCFNKKMNTEKSGRLDSEVIKDRLMLIKLHNNGKFEWDKTLPFEGSLNVDDLHFSATGILGVAVSFTGSFRMDKKVFNSSSNSQDVAFLFFNTEDGKFFKGEQVKGNKAEFNANISFAPGGQMALFFASNSPALNFKEKGYAFANTPGSRANPYNSMIFFMGNTLNYKTHRAVEGNDTQDILDVIFGEGSKVLIGVNGKQSSLTYNQQTKSSISGASNKSIGMLYELQKKKGLYKTVDKIKVSGAKQQELTGLKSYPDGDWGALIHFRGNGQFGNKAFNPIDLKTMDTDIASFKFSNSSEISQKHVFGSKENDPELSLFGKRTNITLLRGVYGGKDYQAEMEGGKSYPIQKSKSFFSLYNQKGDYWAHFNSPERVAMEDFFLPAGKVQWHKSDSFSVSDRENDKKISEIYIERLDLILPPQEADEDIYDGLAFKPRFLRAEDFGVAGKKIAYAIPEKAYALSYFFVPSQMSLKEFLSFPSSQTTMNESFLRGYGVVVLESEDGWKRASDYSFVEETYSHLTKKKVIDSSLPIIGLSMGENFKFLSQLSFDLSEDKMKGWKGPRFNALVSFFHSGGLHEMKVPKDFPPVYFLEAQNDSVLKPIEKKAIKKAYENLERRGVASTYFELEERKPVANNYAAISGIRTENASSVIESLSKNNCLNQYDKFSENPKGIEFQNRCYSLVRTDKKKNPFPYLNWMSQVIYSEHQWSPFANRNIFNYFETQMNLEREAELRDKNIKLLQ